MPGRLNNGKEPGATTLKSVARHVGLSAGTVSSVLNNSPSAAHIPQSTRDRIHAAARELNYRPNLLARSLRKQRTYTLGIIANDLGDAYTSLVIAGIEKFLRQNNYFFISGVHHHKRDQLEAYSDMLMQRGVEGVILVDWNSEYTHSLPTVAVSGHRQSEGVTNIVLNHHSAIFSALKHLADLGHRDIAFMRGHPASADAETRWQAICEIAPKLGIAVKDELVIQFDVEEFSPELGYPFAKQLLARNKPFTALFAYNDLSAIGAMRAFQESGLRIPQDISVIGFDDIPVAVYYYPSLTTLRQPLGAMGELAARTLVERIEGKESSSSEIAVEGELVIRESTGPAPAGSPDRNRAADLVKA